MIIDKTLHDLQCRSDYLMRIIDNADKSLALLPDGYLRIKRQGNSVSYYHMRKIRGADAEELIKNSSVIRDLSQKSYLRKVRNAAVAELKKIEHMMKGYPVIKIEDIYGSLRDDRKKLVDPVALSDEEFARLWSSKPFTPKEFDDDDNYFVTLKGERVRSKSEQIIADRLNYNGIPYRYECPVMVGNRLFHPDFMVLRLSDRREIYWEHCGAMDRPSYSDYAVNRFNIYSQNDIVLGRDLIATFETGQNPLDTRTVDKIISTHFK